MHCLPSPSLDMSNTYKKQNGGRETIFHGFHAFFLPRSAALQVTEKSVADVDQCLNNLGQYVPAHGKTRRGDHKKITLYLSKLSEFCELRSLKSHEY